MFNAMMFSTCLSLSHINAFHLLILSISSSLHLLSSSLHILSSSLFITSSVCFFLFYFSFGVDAQTMHSLHVHRENCRCCHQCRCCTMTCIGLLNTRDCCLCLNPPLNLAVEYLVNKPKGEPPGPDDYPGGFKWVKAPEVTAQQIGAFVMTNLPNYAAGRSAWGNAKHKVTDRDVTKSYNEPDVSDGKLEAVLFDGYNHLASMTICGSKGHRLGQIQGARVAIKSKCFIQLDGEAWAQDEGYVEVVRAPSALMIMNTPRDVAGCADC